MKKNDFEYDRNCTNAIEMFTMISIFKYEKMVTQYACMQRDITYLESKSILACIPVSHNIALLHALCLPILVKNKMIIQL